MTAIGEPFTAAGWYVGPRARANLMPHLVQAFALAEDQAGVVFGPIGFADVTPEDAKAPPPSGKLDEPGVLLLVGEAKVIEFRPRMVAHSFLAELEDGDLARLRAATRTAQAEARPLAPPLTDAECDVLIERLGPDVAARQIMRQVH